MIKRQFRRRKKKNRKKEKYITVHTMTKITISEKKNYLLTINKMHTLHLISGSCVQVFDIEICVVVGVLDFIVELKKSFSRYVNKTANDDNVIKFRRLLCLILKKKKKMNCCNPVTFAF